MPADYLIGLYWFTGIFIVGIFLTIIARRINVPDVLLLVLFGVITSSLVGFNISEVIPISILIGFSLFSLVMIIFESSAKFKLKEVAKLSPIAAKLSVLFILLTTVFLGIFTHLLFFYGKFGINDFIVTLIFASMMGATSPSIVLSITKNVKSKLLQILQFESIINTPLTVILPLILVEFYIGTIVSDYVVYFLQQIMTGVGTGLVIGLIVFNFLYKDFEHQLAPVIIIGTALLAYVIAEMINGNGILAATTLGLVFGRLNIEDKLSLKKFTSVFTSILKIIIFILLGLLIRIPSDKTIIFKSIALFAIYLVIRFIAVKLSFRGGLLTTGQKIFMSLNVPKGIAITVLTFILLGYNIPELETIIQLIYLFILYSIVISSVITIYAKRYIDLYFRERLVNSS